MNGRSGARSYTFLMVGKISVLFLCLLAWSAPLVASALDCGELPAMAQAIHDLRDENAAQGVAQAEALLEDLVVADENCVEGKMLVLGALASNLHILGRSHEGLLHIEQALELLESRSDASPEHRAGIHLTAGVLHWDLEAHDEAIVHYLESLQASEEIGDRIAVARAAGNIGNLYNTTGDYRQAREFHEQALEIFEEEGWTRGVAGTLVNLAALARNVARHASQSGDEEMAREEYGRMLEESRRALDLFEQLGNPRGIAYAKNNTAQALVGLGRHAEAIDIQWRALELQREVGDVSGEADSLMALADIHQGMGEFDAAADLLSEAAERVPEDNLAKTYAVTEKRANLEEARGNLLAALEHQKRLNQLRRVMARNQMAARVEETRLAMRAEQREQELALLRREAEIADLQLKRQQATSVAAVLLVVVLLSLLGLVVIRFRARVRSSRMLEQAARTDPLTGLSNRRDMMERLNAAHDASRKDGDVHGLILADLDDFKQINDGYGHGVGDEALQQLAVRLSETVKGRDVVSRWGGEEFLVLLPDTDKEGARAVAENLQLAMAENPVSTSAGEIDLTLTLGVAELSSAVSVDEAIRQADAAMYQGKTAGKDRFVVHSPPRSSSE